jgi:transcription elongation factor GreB
LAPSSNLLTPIGYRKLKSELEELWKRKRPEVVKALSEAAAEGDRSENAEYQYRKRQLAEIDRRVRHLSRRLANVKVVQEAPSDLARVYFGAWIELEDEEGAVRSHRIVGPDELEHDARHISIDAPLARALLGKRVDDEVLLQAPKGLRKLWVLSIRYEFEELE